MAVRFHLPSKVYDHRNAMDGVERGNILSWRQDVAQALERPTPSPSAPTLDARSILCSTVAALRARPSASPCSSWPRSSARGAEGP